MIVATHPSGPHWEKKLSIAQRIADAALALGDDDRWPLARFGGTRPAAPAWFDAALAVPLERQFVAVDGCDIELLCWGERGWPGLLLLHGSMAHAAWWIAVAPLLAREMRVCALSFSGMGGSGARERYSCTTLAQESWAAAQAGGLFDAPVAPIVAAHSFGGKIAALMAGTGGERLLGTIFVDSFLLPRPDMPASPMYKSRSYANAADALARFRLTPDQPSVNPSIIDAIARAGIRCLPDGSWTWAFDPDFFSKFDHQDDWQDGWAEAINARCPLALLRGEHSLVVVPEEAAEQRRSLAPGTIFVELPDAHHHVMIDQPLALVAAMHSICAGWIAGAR
jgi:pimeloyl-ACP methyl ester carboxylesterase